MLHSRQNNTIIKQLHEKCLRLVFNDKLSSYEELLVKDGSVSIHQKNIQALAIEMFKIKKGLSPEIISDIFTQQTEFCYNLRHQNDFRVPFVRTVKHGSESISYLGPKIWNILPVDLKQLDSVGKFKNSIKTWVPENCPCRLCKTYVNGVGFI